MSQREIPQANTLEVVSSGFEFSDDQRRMIRDTFAGGATDQEFAVLMEIARTRRLNPLFRQIHFVSRWDSEKHRPVWAAQVSIDGLRAIAERTGLYQGQDEPEYVENPDGTLKLCKVRVYRRDWPRERPSVGIAYWAEYVQTFRDKATGKTRPASMWARMPHVMLGKCAESLAFRKAFPEDMSGLYTGEEMSQSLGDLSIHTNNVTVGASVARVLPLAPPRLPSPEESFAMRVSSLRAPQEAVALWIEGREALSLAGSAVRSAAWRALGERVATLGQSDAMVWLRHAVSEEDARREGGSQPEILSEMKGDEPKVPEEVLRAARALAALGPRGVPIPSDPWLDYLG